MGKYRTEAKGKRVRQEREHREGDTIRILKDGDLPGGREKGSQRGSTACFLGEQGITRD